MTNLDELSYNSEVPCSNSKEQLYFTQNKSLFVFYTDEWPTPKRMRLLPVAVVFCSFTKTGKDLFLTLLKETSLILEENAIALETGLR